MIASQLYQTIPNNIPELIQCTINKFELTDKFKLILIDDHNFNCSSD